MTAASTLMERHHRHSTVHAVGRLAVSCWADPAQATPVPGRIRTLSAGGLSLELAFLPMATPYLDIELGDRRHGTTVRLRARVLYALKQGPHGCIIGVSFPEKIGAKELAALVA